MNEPRILLAVILSATLLISIWHIFENIKIRKSIEPHSANIRNFIKRLAWFRSIQIISILFLYGLLLVNYNMKLSEERQEIIKLQNQLYAYKTAKPVILSPLNAQEESQAPDESEIEKVYNPEESEPGRQAAIDSIKKRYEEIVVTYFFMKKCGLSALNDYHIIMSALSQEIASVNAPGRLSYDILTAAQGSYNEMYSKSPCDETSLESLKEQYKAYIDALSRNSYVQ